MTCLLIAGTDTDAGKTVVTTGLAAYGLERSSQDVKILKLMQTGMGDQEFYEAFFGQTDRLSVSVPLRFQAPLAPPLAAAAEGQDVDLGTVWRALRSHQREDGLLLVEALGGLGSPVTWELTVADVAREWRLPTVLVVPVKLGALGQAIANVALARSQKVDLKGLILCCGEDDTPEAINHWANPQLLSSLTHLPIFGTMPQVRDLLQCPSTAAAQGELAAIVSGWDLESLLF